MSLGTSLLAWERLVKVFFDNLNIYKENNIIMVYLPFKSGFR